MLETCFRKGRICQSSIVPAQHEESENLLVETDSRILELVQKELSQEYLRLMTRSMRASADERASDPTLPGLLRGAAKT